MASEQDIQAYIESGNLELYASGSMSLAESAEVETMASQHPEVAAELKRISASLADYALAYERNPRPMVRRKLMDSFRKNAETREQAGPAKAAPSSTILAYKYLLAAAMASLVISTFASYFFYNRWSETEDKSQVLLSEKNMFSQNYTAVKSAFDKSYTDLIIMRDARTKTFALHSPDSTKDYSVRIYWNPFSHETYLDALLMPPPDSGKHYQLWAVSKGKPIDAGIFDLSVDNGLLRMKAIFETESWTVTQEPKGGSVMPTMSSLILETRGRSF